MAGTRRQRRKTILLLSVAALAGGIGVLGYATHVLRRSELLPKTSTGKVQKYLLREQEWAGRDKRVN